MVSPVRMKPGAVVEKLVLMMLEVPSLKRIFLISLLMVTIIFSAVLNSEEAIWVLSISFDKNEAVIIMERRTELRMTAETTFEKALFSLIITLCGIYITEPIFDVRKFPDTQMPSTEMITSIVECLNPAEILFEQPSFPVTKPRMKEWRTKGVRRTLLSVM